MDNNNSHTHPAIKLTTIHHAAMQKIDKFQNTSEILLDTVQLSAFHSTTHNKFTHPPNQHRLLFPHLLTSFLVTRSDHSILREFISDDHSGEVSKRMEIRREINSFRKLPFHDAAIESHLTTHEMLTTEYQ